MIANTRMQKPGLVWLGRLVLAVGLAILVAWQSGYLNAQGPHSITVSWTAPTGATTYNVKRSTTTGAEVKIATVNTPTTSYVDTNGTAGTTYFYVISASNQFGESPNSNEVSALFLGDKPGTPAGVTAVSQ